jgi:hypothetical protein
VRIKEKKNAIRQRWEKEKRKERKKEKEERKEVRTRMPLQYDVERSGVFSSLTGNSDGYSYSAGTE